MVSPLWITFHNKRLRATDRAQLIYYYMSNDCLNIYFCNCRRLIFNCYQYIWRSSLYQLIPHSSDGASPCTLIDIIGASPWASIMSTDGTFSLYPQYLWLSSLYPLSIYCSPLYSLCIYGAPPCTPLVSIALLLYPLITDGASPWLDPLSTDGA